MTWFERWRNLIWIYIIVAVSPSYLLTVQWSHSACYFKDYLSEQPFIQPHRGNGQHLPGSRYLKEHITNSSWGVDCPLWEWCSFRIWETIPQWIFSSLSIFTTTLSSLTCVWIFLIMCRKPREVFSDTCDLILNKQKGFKRSEGGMVFSHWTILELQIDDYYVHTEAYVPASLCCRKKKKKTGCYLKQF